MPCLSSLVFPVICHLVSHHTIQVSRRKVYYKEKALQLNHEFDDLEKEHEMELTALRDVCRM